MGWFAMVVKGMYRDYSSHQFHLYWVDCPILKIKTNQFSAPYRVTPTEYLVMEGFHGTVLYLDLKLLTFSMCSGSIRIFLLLTPDLLLSQEKSIATKLILQQVSEKKQHERQHKDTWLLFFCNQDQIIFFCTYYI